MPTTDPLAARAAYSEAWQRACAAHQAIIGPANTRMDKAIAAAKQAKITDPKAEVPREEITRWLADSLRASAAFQQIEGPARLLVDAALREAKETPNGPS